MKTAAIIGCGRKPQSFGHKVGWGIAHAHAAGYRDAFPGVAFCAVDVNRENLDAFAEEYAIPRDLRFESTKAMYDAVVPDAVSVCTWPTVHAAQTIEAAERGVKAITCEKPLAVDGEEIAAMLGACRRKGARLAVAHQRCYQPAFERLRELVNAGEIGRRIVFHGRVGDDWDVLSWTTHWFDMANFVFDAAPEWVLAGVQHTGQRRYGHAVEDASNVLAQYPGDRQALFVTGPNALPTFGVTVQGDAGLIQVENEATLHVYTRGGYRAETPAAPPEFHGAYASLFADLWRSVNGGPASRCDAERCAAATLMAFATHESARTAKKVALGATPRFAPLEVMEHVAQPAHGKLGKVLLIADQHHLDEATGLSGRDGVLRALQSMSEDVRLVDPKDDPTDADTAWADLLVIYHTRLDATAEAKRVLGAWFAAGRPVVVSHCGIGAYPDWAEYRGWIGRYWVWGHEATADRPASGHPHVPCEVEVVDAAFGVPWRMAWIPRDEVYRSLGEASATRVLAWAKAEDWKEPVAWATAAHPNVVTWLPGHRQDVWDLATLRDGLHAAGAMAMRAGRT